MIDIKNWGNTIRFYDVADPNRPKGKRILICGLSGSGKTRFIGTAPDPFVADIDQGGETLEKLHIPYHEVPHESGAMALTRKMLLDFKGQAGPFANMKRKTFGFDGYTSMCDLALWELTHLPGTGKQTPFAELTGAVKPEFDHWGALRSYLSELTFIMKDISYEGFNVIATSTIYVAENTDLRQTQMLPNIQGSFRNTVIAEFDYAFYFVREKDGFYAYTIPTNNFNAKVRRDFPEKIKDPTWDKLFKTA